MSKKPKVQEEVFYSEISNKLPDYFFQRIVEKENEVTLSKNLSQQSVEELISLYKKVIEFYAFIDNEKVQFYSSRLVKLYVAVKKITASNKGKQELPEQKEEDVVRDHEIALENKHKQNYKQFMVFLQLDQSKDKIENMINDFNRNLSKSLIKIKNELREQKETFKKKLEAKRTIMKTLKEKKDKMIGRKTNMEKINVFVEESLKKFHFYYKNSPIYELAVKCIGELFQDVYVHKIQKFYFYQEQIKQFQLLLGNEEQSGGQHQESIQYYLDELEKERQKYFSEIETNLRFAENKIKDDCLAFDIKEDAKFQEFKLDFLKGLKESLH